MKQSSRYSASKSPLHNTIYFGIIIQNDDTLASELVSIPKMQLETYHFVWIHTVLRI